MTGPVALLKGNNQNRPTGEYSFPFRPSVEHPSYLIAVSENAAGTSERDSFSAANGKLLPRQNACDGQREDGTRYRRLHLTVA
ncbi:hypothetical protein [Bradyrhizobium sp. LMG 9283]|uniref:hypothetical protein n=1 Tax=Bradyrhizobium sp. LMG 9283 TaxID=592064 RepID=UPI00388F5D35